VALVESVLQGPAKAHFGSGSVQADGSSTGCSADWSCPGRCSFRRCSGDDQYLSVQSGRARDRGMVSGPLSFWRLPVSG
jgi:hypothetical protein